MPKITLEAWMKRKWACSEGSSPEAGVQRLTRNIMVKHRIGMPRARNMRKLEEEL